MKTLIHRIILLINIGIAMMMSSTLIAQDMNCIKFNASRLKVSSKTHIIYNGGKKIFFPKNSSEAKEIVRTLKELKADEYCYSGNIKNPDFSILKSRGKFPKVNRNRKYDCLTYKKPFKLVKSGNLTIMASTSRALSFKSKVKAQRTLSFVKKNKLNVQCFCKRPNPALSFWTSSPNTQERRVSSSLWEKIKVMNGGELSDVYVENVNGKLIHEGDILLGENGVPYKNKVPKKTYVYGSEKLIRKKYAKNSSTPKIKLDNTGIYHAASVAANNSGSQNLQTVRNGLYNTFIWPHGRIPYVLNSNLSSSEKQTIKNAIKEINSKTVLDIYPRKNNEEAYVDVRYSSEVAGGRSAVGRQGNKQLLEVKRKVSKGTVMHEFLHAAGFWHEQSRSDRDKHINIHWENIKKRKDHNFDVKKKQYILTPEYDFNSIMHYSSCSFSKDKDACRRDLSFATITTKDGKAIRGSNSMSKLDIAGINKLYKTEVRGRAGKITPSDKYREVKLTLNKVKLVKGGTGFLDFKENFTCKMVAGIGTGWHFERAPKAKYFTDYISIPVINKKIPKFNNKKDYSKPRKTNQSWNWNVSVIIPPGKRYVQTYFTIKEEGLLRDSQVDCNPEQSLKGLYLIIDTYTNEIYLTDKKKKKTNCVGFLGYKMNHIQGYDKLSGGYIVKTNIKEIASNKIKSI